MRFTLVSKSWHDMITNPRRPDSCYSSRTTLLQSSSPSRLLGFLLITRNILCFKKTSWISHHYHNSSSIDKVALVDMDVASDICLSLRAAPFHVLASSNGILLCTSELNTYPVAYFVYNPLTGQKVTLPKLKVPYYYMESIAFDCQVDDMDPTCTPVMHYMIGVLHGSSAEVFSSREKKPRWRNIPPYEGARGYPKVFIYPYNIPGVVQQGVCYWLDYRCEFIMACNLMEGSNLDQWWTIKTPFMEPNHNDHTFKFGAPRNSDSLYLGITSCSHKDFQVWIYSGGVWELKHSIKLWELESQAESFQFGEQPQPHRLLPYSYFSFKGFHPSIPGIVFITIGSKFCSYDFEANILEVHFSCGYYIQSLFPFEWSPWSYTCFRPQTNQAINAL